MRRTAGLTVLALFLLALTYSMLGLCLPLGEVDGTLTVKIDKGMSFRQSAYLLAERGLVRDPNVLIALARMYGLDRRLIPGIYSFEGSLSPLDVFSALDRGRINLKEVTVVEGECMEIIRGKLVSMGLVDPREFDLAAGDAGLMSDLGVDAPSLEGYLYPDTYRLSGAMDAREIIETMVGRLREVYDDGLSERAEELGMSMRDVLTLASIIEKEAALDEERALISAVYHNRLRKRIPLQADPTAVYGVKPPGSTVTRKDLRKKTPYNTYTFRGLPPGPIASPGIKSIRAALYPAEAPYLYFVSNGNGTHTFSVTHRQHMDAVRQYRRNGHREKG